MDGFLASVETIDDGTVGEATSVVMEFRNSRTGRLQRLTLDAFTGAHLLHLAVAGCVHNDLFREAIARGITLTRVDVSADGGFADDWASTGINYRVRVEGDAPQSELEALVAYVEGIAEIPAAIRRGADVRLVAADVTSTSD